MKIAQVCRYYPPHQGGVEIFVQNLSQFLAGKGNNVHVFTTNEPKGKNYQTVKKINVHRYAYKKRFNEPIYDFAGDLKKFKPDVVHCHYPNPHGYSIAYRYSQKENVPLIVTYHARASSSWLISFLSKIFDKLHFYRTVKNANKLVYSHGDIGPKLKNSIVIPTGVDTKKFKKQKVMKDIDVIWGAGRLTKLKRIGWILRAVAKIDRNIIVFIVGPGPEMQNLRKLTIELKLKNVKFLGATPNEKMPRYYSRSRLMVLPSKSEGMPISVLEALACQTPVLASDVGGLSDVIAKEMLFDVNNYKEFKNKLAQSLKKPPKVKLPARFSQESVFNEYLKIYQK